MAEDNLCTIKLVRPPQYADMLRSYEIFLNGKSVGMISRNDVLEIPAPAGAITIEAYTEDFPGPKLPTTRISIATRKAVLRSALR